MGDYAKGVAKIARKIDGEDLPIPAEFDRMAANCCGNCSTGIMPFVRESAAEASSIPCEDDQVMHLQPGVSPNCELDDCQSQYH